MKVAQLVRAKRAGVTASVLLATLASIAGSSESRASIDGSNRPEVRPVLAVSTSGNDRTCSRRNLSQPCLTFNRAYRLARCGDTIRIAAGRYPSQTIVENPSLSTCKQPVTLQAVDGAEVTVNSHIHLGSCRGCYSTDAPSHIVFRGFAYTVGFDIWGDARDVLLDNLDGGGLFIQGVDGVVVRNSDFGPCNSSPPNTCSRLFINEDRNDPSITRNVRLENNRIHDFVINASGDHWECIFSTGGTNVTIRRNRFWNCHTYAIATGARSYSNYKNWVIENNWFGRTCCLGTRDRSSAIVLGGPVPVSDMLIRYNTFISGQGVVTEGGSVGANVRIVRNILQHTGCLVGVRYIGNLFTGGRCSPTDRSFVYGYRYDGARLRVSAEAQAIKAAYAVVVQGRSLKRALQVARKWQPPPGGWKASTLRTLLADDVYLGSRLGRKRDHAPLVSAARWKRVQNRLR